MKQRRDVEPRRPASVLDLDPVRVAAELSQLPPNHAHVVAAKTAAEVSELRHDHKVALRDAAKDVAGDRVWQGYAARHLPHEEVVRRRAEPGPLPRPREAAEAVAEAHRACRDAVDARQEEARAGELNRWAADRADVDVDVDVAVRARV